jgi:colanic acid/amylovoran biosynthesis glycosyltransferase
MRVIEVAYNWPAETFIQRHVLALQDVSFPIKLVARDKSNVDSVRASLGSSNTSVQVDILPNFNHLRSVDKLLSLRHLTFSGLFSKSGLAISDKTLLGYFERLHPDLVHFHDATLAASLRWIPLTLGITYTLSLRGSDVQVFPLQSQNQCELILSAIEGAAGVHAVCDALGKLAMQLLGHDLAYSVVYTTVPIPAQLSPLKNISKDDPIHLVSSGRFMWRKGFNDLLIAVRQMRDKGLNVTLTLVGTGPDLDHLLYLRNVLGLGEAVNLPGKMQYEKILELFRSAHAYVQSSVAEGISNSLAEAMSNGLPVFATDVGGTSEVIDEGITGFLLPPFCQRNWAEKLMLVYDQPLMEQVRSSGYEKARQLFSADQHAKKFVEFYESYLNCS